MNRIKCSPIMDRNAIDRHLEQLKNEFSGKGHIAIDCSQIEQIGMAGLQLLASAIRTGQLEGRDVRLLDVSGQMEAAITLAGMRSILLDRLPPITESVA